MKAIHCLRHCNAVLPEGETDNLNRRPTELGERQQVRRRDYLLEVGLDPDQVAVTPTPRTLLTMYGAVPGMNKRGGVIVPGLYSGTSEETAGLYGAAFAEHGYGPLRRYAESHPLAISGFGDEGWNEMRPHLDGVEELLVVAHYPGLLMLLVRIPDDILEQLGTSREALVEDGILDHSLNECGLVTVDRNGFTPKPDVHEDPAD